MFFTYFSVYKNMKNKSYDLLNKWWPIEQIINKIILYVWNESAVSVQIICVFVGMY